jgi:3-hydroxyisobutyrate dehydrogenase-like beta-hydroxyacid dehydrogenase
MKLLNQALVACYFAAAAETYNWSRKTKVKRKDMTNIISNSWGDSPVFRHFMNTIEAGRLKGGAKIRILKKDVDMILRNARRDGARMRLLETVETELSSAMQKGLGEMDATSLYLEHS